MLTTIRQFQKTILIIVTVIIIVAFAFLYSDYDFAKASLGNNKNCLLEVNGKCYKPEEAQKLASYRGLAYGMGLNDFAENLSGVNRMDRDPTDFVLNLLVLRETAKEMGIEPTDAEVKAAIPEAPIFERAPFMLSENTLEMIVGQQGLTTQDLFYLFKDYLSFEKLRELIGGGVKPVSTAVKNDYIQRNQRYTAHLVDFKTEDFVDKVEITDEQIQTYYDARNGGSGEEDDKLDKPAPDPAEVAVAEPETSENPAQVKYPPILTFQKRGFDYLKFSPAELPEDATQEQKVKADFAFASAVNEIYSQLTERGVDFMGVAEEVAAKTHPFKVELAKLEKFARVDAPESINSDFRLLGGLFSETFKEGNVSVPHENEDGSFYIFRFNEYEKPREKTLAEAREEIVETLTSKQSKQLANDAASAALAKLGEGIAGGKSIEDVTKENNLELVALPNFSEMEMPADTADAYQVVGSVRDLKLGQKISKVTERPGNKGYFITYVDKIEIYKDENREKELENLAEQSVAMEKEILFRSWLKQQGKASNPKRHGSLLNVVQR